jgi:hypothetical protein
MLLGTAAHAELTYEADVGIGYSDNIRRVTSGEEKETLADFGLNLDWSEHTRRLDASVLTDIGYVDYLNDTFDSEVLGTADASLTFGILPERFTWLLQDSFGQASTDPFAPVTPDTRENINYFTTGPDFILRFGGQNALQLFGRYSSTDYEESDLDGERVSAGLRMYHELSAASRVGLNAVADRSEFDSPQNPGYDRDSVFLSYDLNAGRTIIAAQAGYSWLETDGRNPDAGPLFDITVTREVSAASTLIFSVSDRFTDAGEALGDFAGAGGEGGQVPVDVTAAAEPYENRELSLEWQFSRNRTGINLSVNRTESDYEVTETLDRNRTSYFGSYTRRLQPTLDLIVSGEFIQTDFGTGSETEEWRGSLEVSWRLTRHLGVRLSAESSDRTATEGLGEYREQRAMLSFTYSGGRPGGEAAR